MLQLRTHCVINATLLLTFIFAACLGCTPAPNPTLITPKLCEPNVQLSSELRNGAVRPLVRIEYPVGVKEGKEVQVLEVWRRSEINVHPPGYFETTPRTKLQTSLSKLITKSHYFALEFYLNLAETMPSGTVVLEPVLMSMDENGIVRPEAAVSPVPTPIIVHFGVASRLLPVDNGAEEYDDTFGAKLGPDVSIDGINLVTGRRDFLAASSVVQLSDGTIEGLSPFARLNNNEASMKKYWNTRPEVAGLRTTSERPVKKGDLQIIPSWHWEYTYPWFAVTDQQLAGYIGESATESPFAPLWQYYGNYIREYLNISQTPDARQAHLIAYGRFLGCSRSDPAALSRTEKCIALEADFLHTQDTNYAKAAYQGEFGKSIREMMFAEAEALRARNIQNNQLLMQSLTSASMSLYGTAATANGTMSPAQNVGLQMSLMSSNMNAMQQHQQSQSNSSTQFFRHFERILEAQSEFSLKTGVGERKIRAKGLDELRPQLASIIDDDSLK